MFSDRSEIQEIIFKAEITADRVGDSVMVILAQYAEDLKPTNPKISEKLTAMVRMLKNGRKRWDAYGVYIDQDVAQLLKMADKKNIPVGLIINSYVPAKAQSVKYTKGIRKALIAPVVTYIITTLLLGYAVDNFKKPIEDKVLTVSDTIMLLMNNYYVINFVFIGFVAALLITIPHKLPGLKAIFVKLESILALATIDAMLSIGYSTSEIIPEIKKQFNIQSDPKRRNVDGLVEMLSKKNYISPFESAEIKIMTKQDDPKIAIKAIVADRKEEAAKISESISKLISTMAVLLVGIPALLMISVFVAFLQSAISLGTSGG